MKLKCPRCGGDLRVHHVMKLSITIGDREHVIGVPVITSCPECDGPQGFEIIELRGEEHGADRT